MNIEEMAKKWVEIEIINDPLLNDPDWEQVKRCMSYALTSLLEELPEPYKETDTQSEEDPEWSYGYNACLRNIKSLIQTKLK